MEQNIKVVTFKIDCSERRYLIMCEERDEEQYDNEETGYEGALREHEELQQYYWNETI